jgi:hypothetical protein
VAGVEPHGVGDLQGFPQAADLLQSGAHGDEYLGLAHSFLQTIHRYSTGFSAKMEALSL